MADLAHPNSKALLDDAYAWTYGNLSLAQPPTFKRAAAVGDVLLLWPIPANCTVHVVELVVPTARAAATLDVGYRFNPGRGKDKGLDGHDLSIYVADDGDYWLDGQSIAVAGTFQSRADPITFPDVKGYVLSATVAGAALTAAAGNIRPRILYTAGRPS